MFPHTLPVWICYVMVVSPVAYIQSIRQGMGARAYEFGVTNSNTAVAGQYVKKVIGTYI